MTFEEMVQRTSPYLLCWIDLAMTPKKLTDIGQLRRIKRLADKDFPIPHSEYTKQKLAPIQDFLQSRTGDWAVRLGTGTRPPMGRAKRKGAVCWSVRRAGLPWRGSALFGDMEGTELSFFNFQRQGLKLMVVGKTDKSGRCEFYDFRYTGNGI